MAPILRFVTSSGSKKKEPRYGCLSEARASLSHRTWTRPAQPYYHQIRPIVHIGDIWLHCAPEVSYCLCDPLPHCNYLQTSVSRDLSVPSLSSPPSTPDALVTEIPKHRRQWSQRFTPSAYRSAYTNVSSARCDRQLQQLTFNDHVRWASTVDVVSFPGGSWLLSRMSDNTS